MMEEWKNNYRKALSSHEKSTPEGLWNDVSSKMAARKKRRNFFIYSLSAAAAALAIAVFIFRPSGPAIEPINNTANNVLQPIVQNPVQVIAPSKPQAILATNEHSANNVKGTEEKKPEVIIENNTVSNTSTDTSVTETAVLPVPLKEDKKVEKYSQEPSGRFINDFQEEKIIKRAPIRIGAALSGIAASSSSTGSSPVMLSDAASFGDDGFPRVQLNNKLEAEKLKTDSRHRQPIRFMFSVGIPLTNRLSFNTGLSYSLHHSDITTYTGSATYKSVQRLNFVGIPAGLSYRLWGNDIMNLNLGAGAMAEKMVYGTLRSDGSDSFSRVRLKSLQGSLYGIAGLEFHLTPRLVFGLEPGVSYYFIGSDDNVSTIYSDQPLNFELRFSLKVNL